MPQRSTPLRPFRFDSPQNLSKHRRDKTDHGDLEFRDHVQQVIDVLITAAARKHHGGTRDERRTQFAQK